MALTVAASDSMARSASTLAIRGLSASRPPNASRCDVWWIASAIALRMTAADPSEQSSRVWLTISMIVRTPAPSSPTIRAQVPASSISLDAFERSPSLSFRRWMRKTFGDSSGVHRGTRKQLSPPGVWASIRNASLIGAEQNHLCPVSRYSPAGPPPSIAVAVVVLARTSDPPCFSVIAMPQVRPALLDAGAKAPS